MLERAFIYVGPIAGLRPLFEDQLGRGRALATT